MRGMGNIKDLNDTATLSEYEAALRLGNDSLAKKIRQANPDLEGDFRSVSSLFK